MHVGADIDETVMVDFGEQLRNLRSRLGLTQVALAEASRLGQSTISALETGRQSPWPSTRLALARAFRMSLEEFDAQMVGAEQYRAGSHSGMRQFAAPDNAPRPAPEQTAISDAPAIIDQGSRADQSPAPPTPASRPRGVYEPSHTRPSRYLGQGASEFHFAPAKVMELLNQLGHAEHQLNQYQSFLDGACSACWTTDATLHITGSFGPIAMEQRSRHGDFRGRHIGEFFEAAWGEDSAAFLPLLMHQKSADGQSVGFCWDFEGSRYMVFIDPIRDHAGKVIGTIGLAIDLSERELLPEPRP
jgi:transcriptional regulator with XRE-family HTH domain